MPGAAERNKLAVIGLIIVVTFSLIAILAPVLAPYGQAEVVDYRLARHPPELDVADGSRPERAGHLQPHGLRRAGVAGGRRAGASDRAADRHSRSALSPAIFGGRTDNVLMRLVDVIYAIPQLLLVMIFVNWWGPGLLNIFLAIGLVGWVTEARLVRGQFLSLREQEYVSAARVAGGERSLHHSQAHAAQQPDADHRGPHLRHSDRDLHRGGAELRRRRHSAAAGELGADGGRGEQPGYIETDPHMLLFPVLAIGLTMLGIHLPRRRPARRARSEGEPD